MLSGNLKIFRIDRVEKLKSKKPSLRRANPLLLVYAIMLFALPCSPSVKGENPAQAHFEQGNKFYEERKYSEAISEYHWLEAKNKISSHVLFNMGNAFFKNGEIGRAINAYANAAVLSPRDPDIHANLEFTRDSISSSISVVPGPFENIITRLSLNEVSWLAMIFFWLWLALLILPQWRPKLRGKYKTTTRICGALFLFWAAWLVSASLLYSTQTAIVVQREAIVRLGPLDESQTAFTAPDGTELKVLGQRSGWIQVADRQERSGWVRQGSVLLFPAS